jgi:hypothetical protein
LAAPWKRLAFRCQSFFPTGKGVSAEKSPSSVWASKHAEVKTPGKCPRGLSSWRKCRKTGGFLWFFFPIAAKPVLARTSLLRMDRLRWLRDGAWRPRPTRPVCILADRAPHWLSKTKARARSRGRHGIVANTEKEVSVAAHGRSESMLPMEPQDLVGGEIARRQSPSSSSKSPAGWPSTVAPSVSHLELLVMLTSSRSTTPIGLLVLGPLLAVTDSGLIQERGY